MPLKRCTNNGVSGWKYGDSGHCYTGPDAKKKAIKQGIVMEGGPENLKAQIEKLDMAFMEHFELVVDMNEAIIEYEDEQQS